MILSYNELHELVEDNVISADHSQINGTSIDVCLGDEIMIEDISGGVIDPSIKQPLNMISIKMRDEGYILSPGEVVLACTKEIFNLPNNLSCEFKLKSSIARVFINNMLATWCDPCWSNSVLTLELKNDTRYHSILIKPNMKIGQMIFFESKPVPHEKSYAVNGRYNNTVSVTASKGV